LYANILKSENNLKSETFLEPSSLDKEYHFFFFALVSQVGFHFFCLQLAMAFSSPTSTSFIAGFTGVRHHTWLVL
jgi:hypothetical protein